MKKSMMICASVALIAAFGSTARAVNPAEWDFFLETFGSAATWGSPTVVDTGFPQYDYNWQLTQAQLQLEVDGFVWINILDSISPGDKSGSGTANGLPFDILNSLHIDQPGITADIYALVSGGGLGQALISDITFGQVEDNGTFYNVTGARFGGEVTVTGVPEPATVFLLGVGCLALLGRRRA